MFRRNANARFLMWGVATLSIISTGAVAQTVPVRTAASAPQSASEGPSETSDIVVTAQKRSERLRDVPISITAASRETLDKQGISRPVDLVRIVPGLTYQEGSYGTPVFTIRGIGLYDTSVGIAPTVSVYVDQVPLPYLAMTPGASLDVERVEVLKGPQGTLFGQNSTGGAINYIAAKPTSTPHMGFDLTYGRFDQVEASGFVSGPITDTLRVRVSARHDYRGPWQHSESRPSDELGKRDYTAGRILVDSTPSDRLSAELSINGWRDRSETLGSQFVNLFLTKPLAAGGYLDSTVALGSRRPAPNNARFADWDDGANLQRNDRMYQVAARLDYELGDDLTVTSLSAYSDFRGHTPTDADGTNFPDIQVLVTSRIRSFSQELRLAAKVGPARVTVGGNYQHDLTDEDRTTFSLSSNQGAGPFRFNGFTLISNQRVNTYAAFANVDVEILPKLSVQVGGRYTKQDRDFEGCLKDTGNGGLSRAFSLITGTLRPNGACVTVDSVTGHQPDIISDALNQHNFSWKAGVSYKAVPSTNLYANVTRGYKAGAFSPLPAIFSQQLTPVTQESVLAYEVGLKTTLIDRLLDFTGAVFYYKYEDKQILGTGVFPPFGPLPQLQNIPKSSVRGGEVELVIRPTVGLRLQAGGTYVDSRVDSHYLTPDPYGIRLDVKGEAFPNTPKWQAVGNADYELSVGRDLTAFINANYTYRSASNAAFGENALFRFRPYSLVGARGGLGSADDKWRVELWAQNIFNKFYWLNVSKNVDATSRAPGMPATYGLTLRSRF